MKHPLHAQTEKAQESGFVAIFSVIFFALLAMVITVGFIRIMTVEQRQALNNDLTARALAAAEAGVEDAKRIVAHYNTLAGAERAAFRDAMDSSDCDALFAAGALPVTQGVIKVGGEVASDQSLRYTCLTIDLDTADYLKTIGANENHVIPLRSGDDFNQIELEWHLNSDAGDDSGDGLPDNYQLAGGIFPTVEDFSDGIRQPPAYLRVQLIGVPNAGFNRDSLESRSRTVFLSPIESSGDREENAGLTFQTADTPGNSTNNYGFNTTKLPLPVECVNTSRVDDNLGGYACKVTLTLPGGALSAASNSYYLQVTPLYRDTHIRAVLAESGAMRTFEGVQPRVDSTGAAADTFRRVEARISLPGRNFEMPRYGTQVSDNICKQFQVTNDPAHYANTAPC